MPNIRDLALEAAALKTLADVVAERQKTVKAELQQQLTDTGIKTLDAQLPDGTKVAAITRAIPKTLAKVADLDALTAWVTEHYPHNTVTRTEVRPAFLTKVLDELTKTGTTEWADETTGEVHDVPGVEFKTGTAYHTVKPAPGSREAITAAWQEGHLHSLLQITPTA